MSAAVLFGVAAAAAVVAAAAPGRPTNARIPAGSAIRSRPGILVRVGSRLRRSAHLEASPLSDLLLGALAPASAIALVVAPPLLLLLAGAVWAHGQIAARRALAAAERAVARGLPDTVDLLLLCVGAGLSLPLAHPLVAARSPSPLGEALGAADSAAARGRPRADALLDTLVPLGERAAALGHTLVEHLRYGTPLGPGLERLNLELRLDRRRRAEEDVRRVPVRLLGPLVTCVLPAFGLLTVVPLLAASLQALPR